MIIIIIIFIQFPSYYNQDPKKDYNMNSFDMKGFFENFGQAIFAFNCLTNFFSVASAIKQPNIRRLRKVFVRSFTFLLLLCSAVGLMGYLSIGKALTPKIDLIIYREKLGDTDYAMQSVRVALIMCLFVNGGINAFPLKKMIGDYLGWQELTTMKNLSLCFFLIFLPTAVASFFTTIETYVSITGCFTGTLLVIFFPAIMGVKIRYFKRGFWKYFLYFYIGIIVALTIVCTYFTFLKFIHN